MRCRNVPVLCLTLLTLSFLTTGSTQAATIDPELLDALSEKAGGMVPVLMIFDNPRGVTDLAVELESLSPSQRRTRVIQTLKVRNLESQRGAMSVLESPAHQDEIADVTQLYFAGAIAFKGSGNIVQTLGALPDQATLFLDKSYDLTSDTSRGAIGEPGQVTRRAIAWSISYINADRVWNELGFTGEGVIVGHIDSGIDLDHPDLAGRLWVNVDEIPGNGIDDDNNGFIDDVNGWDFGDNDNNPNDDSSSPGHGTHTAGTVAGDGTGGTQTGVAPGAKLMACKAFDSASSGTVGMIWAAEQYCVENGARLMTMSLGVKGDLSTTLMRSERVNMNNIRDAGVTMFNSAGNEHFEFRSPDRVRHDRARSRSLESPADHAGQSWRRGCCWRYRLPEQLPVQLLFPGSSQMGQRGSLQRLALPPRSRPDQTRHCRPWGWRELHHRWRRLQRRYLERDFHGLSPRGRPGRPHAGEESQPLSGRS